MIDYRQQPSLTAYRTTRQAAPWKPYRYNGDGHDSVNPEQCDCGRCGYRYRYAPKLKKEE